MTGSYFHRFEDELFAKWPLVFSVYKGISFGFALCAHAFGVAP
jgi:hypothetical protein